LNDKHNAKLSKKEEAVMVEQFGEDYLKYREKVPAFFPKRLPRIKDIS
jgi:protein-S-isoprenylcysteine O-methyltransferase Ste14